jgi:hypothetical protein
MKIDDYTIPVRVIGHVSICDDLGNVLVDKFNAVHPQNLARVFARGLANESNSFVYRVAFGNGGTIVDAASSITYKTPNDGQAPDTATWRSKLYNETYTEIVDDSDINIGQGIGSSKINDPASTLSSGPGVRSQENGMVSSVVINVVLNPFEPAGQTNTDQLFPKENTEDLFVFDEIGLFTAGAPLLATSGLQNVNVNTKLDSSVTGLSQNTTYTFAIVIDAGTTQVINILTGVGSGVGGEILYSDLVPLINNKLTNGKVKISNSSGTINTYGKLQFTSNTTGQSSSVDIDIPTSPPTNWLFGALTGYFGIDLGISGVDQGNQNNLSNPAKEGERMLSHLIFSPVRKSANRTLTINYTLTIQVARSST